MRSKRARSSRSTSSSRVTCRVPSRRSRSRCSRSRSTTSVQLRIIHRGVGAITESDINLATIDNAIIIGLQRAPRPEGARARGPRGRRRALLLGHLQRDRRCRELARRACSSPSSKRCSPVSPRSARCSAPPSSATSPVSSSARGTITRNAKARVIRDGVVVGDGLAIESLRRFKDDVTEVKHGLRVRHRPRQVQRHPGRRRDRDHRDEGEAAGLYHGPRWTGTPVSGHTRLKGGRGLRLGGVRSRRLGENDMADPARAAKMADRIKVIVAKRLERGTQRPAPRASSPSPT